MSREFFNYRQDYSRSALHEDQVPSHPIELMELWIKEAIDQNHPEPLAFVLSTTSAQGQPSSRVVLLKQLTPEGLVFFTNYQSRKGEEISKNQQVAALFFWPLLERQIRVEGKATRTPESLSDKYFNERPLESRIAAIISPQSATIPSRQWLDDAFENAKQNLTSLKRPAYWGGYIILPHLIEFWQGRPNRLHDRIVFRLTDQVWHISRLAP